MASDNSGIVVAAYNFTAENDDELDVEEGTRLRTLEKREEWWFAETEDGSKRGIIPVSYVVSEEEYARMLSYDDEDSANGMGTSSAPTNSFDVDEVDISKLPDVSAQSNSQAPNAQAETESAKPTFAKDNSATTSSVPPPPSPGEAELAWRLKNLRTTQDMTSGEPDSGNSPGAPSPPASPPVKSSLPSPNSAPGSPVPAGGIASGADPDLAKETPPEIRAEVPSVSYDDLASKFEELQRRVASVRLHDENAQETNGSSTDSFNANAESSQHVPIAETIPEEELQMPPPIDLGAYQRSGASTPSPSPSSPPSPQQAAAALALQNQVNERVRREQQQQQQQQQQQNQESQRRSSEPAPPSPQLAQQALESRRREEQRRASAEEESIRRAEHLRSEREKQLRMQQAAATQDMEGREHIRRVGQGAESKAQEFKRQAIEAAKMAVEEDQAKRFDKAYEYYIIALEAFCKVLEFTPKGGPRDNRGVICDRMQTYLVRMSALEPLFCTGAWSDGKKYALRPRERYQGRVNIIMQMAKTGYFNPGTYGDELRIRARFAESKGDERGAFRALSEGLEYYMAIHKILKESGKPNDDALMMHISSMLSSAERLKQKF
mmetsp:Transcript_8425/g.16779  ORF Transcript_8425/g.16779 Transcript_8425/m.16779 type:complete len:608 (+) Transcript_8425:400-2223(+)